MSWGGKARVHPKMDVPFLRKAKAAGLSGMIFGIESGSQAIVDSMQKRMSLDVAERVIHDCHEVGLWVGCFLIAGYLNETEADFQMTLDFIERNKRRIDMYLPGGGLIILPGSELEKRAAQLGIILSADSPDGHWRSADGTNTVEMRRERVGRLLRKVEDVTREKSRAGATTTAA